MRKVKINIILASVCAVVSFVAVCSMSKPANDAVDVWLALLSIATGLAAVNYTINAATAYEAYFNSDKHVGG